MGKLKSFEEYVNNREIYKQEDREKMQQMWEWIQDNNKEGLTAEEIKQLKTSDRKLYQEVMRESREEYKRLVEETIDPKMMIGLMVALIGIMVSFIVHDVGIAMASGFTGLSIMLLIHIIDNENGFTEERVRKIEQKLREYRFSPKEEKIPEETVGETKQEPEETITQKLLQEYKDVKIDYDKYNDLAELYGCDEAMRYYDMPKWRIKEMLKEKRDFEDVYYEQIHR